MPGIQIQVTTAGRAALVNAANTGTLPVTIAQVGVTATAFVASAASTALPGELKRLSTIAGKAVADDTLHVTVADNSDDVYSMRGFGLYLADGTLFALYGQAGVILEKSAQATMLLASDIIFADIAATSLTFGNTDFMNPPATTEVLGVVELATDAESNTGTDDVRAVTPKGLKYVIDQRFGAGAPSAFVKTLLTLATAAAIRTALALKSASLKDEGAGNGLDADLLDGQQGSYYLAWANLTGKPTTFAPSAHTHAWADINDPPVQATRWPAWGEVTGKPTTFAPAAHSHDASDVVTGTFANARISQGSVTQHQAALSIAWTQVTGKPATYAPSAHTHEIADVTGLQSALNGKASLSGATFTGPVAVAMGNSRQLSVGSWAQVSATGGGNVLFGSNAVVWQDGTFRYGATHSNFGAAGIVLNAFGEAGPWFFDMGDVAATADQAFTPNLCRIYHSGNFNPASKSDTNHTHGNAYVANDSSNAVALGWIGSQVRVRVDSSTWNLWHTGNFDPNGKASLGASVRFGDVYCDRGNGTGVVFLNGAGDRYLHWNGGSYIMPGGQLVVDGGFQKGSSRELKNIDGPLPYGLAELLKIETAIGSYKPEFCDEGGRKRLFVIAEQLADIVPEPVFREGIEFDGRRVASVDDGQLVPLLIRAVQELAAQVAELREVA